MVCLPSTLPAAPFGSDGLRSDDTTMPQRKNKIERTWTGMFGGWLNRADYDANRLLELLDELEEGLKVPRSDFSQKPYHDAKKIYTTWDRLLIKHTERETMFRELCQALHLLYGASFASSYSQAPQPLALRWADNVFKIASSGGLKVARSASLDEKSKVDEKEAFQGKDEVSELNKGYAARSVEAIARANSKHLRIAEVALDAKTTNVLYKLSCHTLVLIGCDYPQHWENVFPVMTQLRRLVIFGGDHSQPPSDDFEGMRSSGVSTLELVMADFMLHLPCMQALEEMPDLVILSLARTITKEKVAITDASVPKLVAALVRLIRVGRLRELNVAYCSALTLEDLKLLAACLRKNDGRLIVGGPTQLELLE